MESKITEGVKLCVQCWSALNLALDNGWGEEEHKEKLIEELTDIVLNCHIDEPTLEEYLEEFMEYYFQVILEDDSTKEIAKILVKLYEESKVGETEQLEKLRKLWESKQPQVEEITQNVRELELDPPKLEPIVDEDGFEVVQSKNQRKKK